MDRSAFMGKTRRILALLLVFTLYPQLHALGGGEAQSIDTAEKEDLRFKQIALSLRIAKAKGKESSRVHYQSLLRHTKRKALRSTMDGGFGYIRPR
jgi:hypothetical protein